MPFKDIVYLELWRPFCSADWNHLYNFGRGYHEEQFCETILNLDQWLRRCNWKIFLIWSSGGPFALRRGTICAILVEGIMRNNSVIFFFEFGPLSQEEMPFEYNSIWSSGGHFVQWSGTTYAILEEGIKRKILWNYFEFWPVVQEEMSFKDMSYLELWRIFIEDIMKNNSVSLF